MLALYVLVFVLIVVLIYVAIVIESYKIKMDQVYTLIKKLDFSRFELTDENKRLIYYGRKYKEILDDKEAIEILKEALNLEFGVYRTTDDDLK